jgi:hypothetical protein
MSVNPKVKWVVVCTALVVLIAAAAVEPALAAPSGTDGGSPKAPQPGQQLGDWITGFAKPLLLAIAGFMGIAALVNQRVGQAFTLLVITVVVGSFLYAGPEIGTFIQALTKSIFTDAPV